MGWSWWRSPSRDRTDRLDSFPLICRTLIANRTPESSADHSQDMVI